MKDKAATRENFGKVAKKIFAEAKGFGHNTFKIELGKRAFVRALEQAANELRRQLRIKKLNKITKTNK